MRAAFVGLDEGTFTEGHELDGKTEKQIPKGMIGKRLTQREVKRLLRKQAQLATPTTWGPMLRADPRPSEKYPENQESHSGESEYRPDKQ